MLNLTCSINWCMRLNLVGWTRDFLQPHSCEIMIIRFKSHLEKERNFIGRCHTIQVFT